MKRWTIKKNRKQSMTLLEIMLVIGILAMLGSLLAFKAKDLLDIYGFRQEVSLLKGRLELARYYALNYKADVEVLLYIKQGTLQCELRSDEPYLHTHTLFVTPCVFKKIKAVTLLNQENTIESLLFSGTGWMFPVANLEAHSVKNQYTAKILIGNNLK